MKVWGNAIALVLLCGAGTYVGCSSGSGGGDGGAGAAGGAGGTGTTSSTTTNSSTTSDTTTSDTTTSSTTTSSTTTSSTTTSSTTTSSTTSTTTVDCQSLPDPNECQGCVVTQDPGGFDAYANAFVTGCGCGNATCGAVCDTGVPQTDVCGPPVDVSLTNDACYDCLNGIDGADSCVPTFLSLCEADPACTNFMVDIQACTDPMTDCTMQATFDECFSCYIEEDPIGYNAYVTAFVGQCGCGANQSCAADCDTNDPSTDVCGPPFDLNVLNQPCVDCLNMLTGDEACLSDAAAACDADPSCNAFLLEVQGCPQ